MDIGIQIKRHRKNLKMSQEQLAEKICVSRQTISNWENGKNYPDIHSLLLLGSVFGTSLDDLIKGDIPIMKKEIDETEIAKFKRCAAIYAVLLILSVVLLVPFLKFMSWYGLIPWTVLYSAAVYFASKADKMKSRNDISTYKEVVAFMDGRQLDEISKQREIGKRPYQTAIYVAGSGMIGFAAVYAMAKVLSL